VRDGRSLALTEQQTTKRSEIVQRASARDEVLIELRQLEVDNPKRIQPPPIGEGDVFENRGANFPDLLAEQFDVFVGALQ
jgi:hypothetical protein